MLLARAVRAHDRAALEALHGKYYLRVKAYVTSHLGSCPEVDDVVQEVFLALFRGGGCYDGHGDPLGYILGIAQNAVRRCIRGKQRDLKHDQDHLPEVLAEHLKTTHQYDPHRLVCDQEALAVIRTLMADLSPEARQAMRLRFVEELDARQSAAKAGCSVPAYVKRLHTALKQLQRRWRKLEVSHSAALPAAAPSERFLDDKCRTEQELHENHAGG